MAFPILSLVVSPHEHHRRSKMQLLLKRLDGVATAARCWSLVFEQERQDVVSAKQEGKEAPPPFQHMLYSALENAPGTKLDLRGEVQRRPQMDPSRPGKLATPGFPRWHWWFLPQHRRPPNDRRLLQQRHRRLRWHRRSLQRQPLATTIVVPTPSATPATAPLG